MQHWVDMVELEHDHDLKCYCHVYYPHINSKPFVPWSLAYLIVPKSNIAIKK